jgi:outer membrane protein assembly factor BamB
MRNTDFSLFLALLATAVALAADWPCYRGDAQLSGWQKHGKQITVENAKNLKLLWKQQLDETPVTVPLIMGPTITHRGVRELVFIGVRNNLYAFDADLGTLFWKRSLEGLSGTPVFEPDPDEDDRDDDEPGPLRPIYAVSGDGRLHAIRVSDGSDISTVDFLPPGKKCSNLNYWHGTVYAGTAEGVWSFDVKKPSVSAQFRPMSAKYGVRISVSGTVAPAETAKPGAPVIVNGVLFVVSGGTALKALNAQTGREIYSSSEPVQISAPDLAVANGHICFAGDALYCFGIPMER